MLDNVETKTKLDVWLCEKLKKIIALYYTNNDNEARRSFEMVLSIKRWRL